MGAEAEAIFTSNIELEVEAALFVFDENGTRKDFYLTWKQWWNRQKHLEVVLSSIKKN